MRTYGQYCPIARASEILAERWTPIILRNLLHGSTTFTAIADGAPGIPRTILTKRLRELERVGVIEATPNPSGRGFVYRPSEAGRDLADVMAAMGRWGERWIELAPEHLDPGMVLHAWVHWYLALDRLPTRRVVVRFDFPVLRGTGSSLWIIFDAERSEVCLHQPGLRRGRDRRGRAESVGRVASRADRVARRAARRPDRSARAARIGAGVAHVEPTE